MDQERQRIQDDLRGLLDGEVRCDDVIVQLYASDASIYQLTPLGVVRPRHVGDVVTCVQYAAENGIAIHARGAGTGLAGESLGRGLILDFSHSMRRVVSVDEETVRVQPGVVLGQLNRLLAEQKQLYGPDPATRSVTTMGSVLALDASGSHWLKYGSARDTVVSLQVVLADGEVIEASQHAIDDSSEPSNSRCRHLVRRLADLLQRRQSVLAEHQPKSLVNRCGYRVHDVLRDGTLDLARLLVGSEGTLALITEATLRIARQPAHRGVALLFFDRLEAAARAALEVRDLAVSACDMMDRRLLSLAREMDVRYEMLIPPAAEAMLLIEQDGEDRDELRERLEQLVARLRRRKRLAFDSRMALEREQRDLYWRLARRVVPTLYRLKGSTQAVPFIEDVAIPPETLPDFIVRLQNLLKRHQVTATLFAHAGHGQLHIRPLLDLTDPAHVQLMQRLAEELYEEVWQLGGTISGEHGAGLSRTAFVARQYGPLYEVFREVKRIFDPQNILNPGKVVTDQPQPVTADLRVVGAAAVAPASDDRSQPPDGRPLVTLQLNWTSAEIALAARQCNGCGRCRTTAPAERMCPIFRMAPAEEASPRAKANLMRAILAGQLNPELLSSDAVKAVADLCVHCHQCRLECPASVDIPKLMVECKAQYVATNGLRPSDWLLTRPDLVGTIGSWISPIANWAIGNRTMRWLLEKSLGIAQGRKLPRFARSSFLKLARRRRLTRPTRRSGRKVLYFVDAFANWHDVELAEALVAILEHNGIAVYVHPAQRPAGMAMIAMGAIDRAKRLAAHNVALLAEAVRQGYHIVTTEPAAALCLKHEYLNLLEDDEAQLVAENSSEACTYLWRLHEMGQLELDFKPLHVTVAYHEPCHMRALRVGTPGVRLLRLIPGLSVRRLESGCSGMAGTYGLKRKNYRSSLRIGWGLISALRDPTIQLGTTECSSCKMQMEQGTTKPTIHPLKLLAASYGLLPGGERLTSLRGQELIVT